MNNLLKNTNLNNSFLQERAPEAHVARADVDSSLKYFLIFLVLGVGMTIFWSYRLFVFTVAPDLSSFIIVAACTALILLIVAFHSLLIKSWQYNAVLAIAETGALLTFFFGNFHLWYLIAAAGFFVFWLIGFRRGRKDVSERLSFDFKRYALIMFGAVGIGLALFLAVLYGGMYEKQRTIGYNAYEIAFSATVTPAVRPFIANFGPELAVEQTLEGYVRDRLSREPDFGLLSQSEKDQVVKQVAFELRNQIVQATSLPVTAGETVGSYTHRVLSQFLAGSESRNLGPLILLVIISGIFFFVRLLLFIIKWPVLLISVLVYYLLLSLNVVSIESDTRQKEVLVIK